jgi:hypothetical protein
MAGESVSAAREWFVREAAGAPEVLRDRASRFVEAQPPSPDVAEVLARAATAALGAALARGGDRSAALDLLAADALVTLALKARAVERPETLAAFAASLGAAGAAIR